MNGLQRPQTHRRGSHQHGAKLISFQRAPTPSCPKENCQTIPVKLVPEQEWHRLQLKLSDWLDCCQKHMSSHVHASMRCRVLWLRARRPRLTCLPRLTLTGLELRLLWSRLQGLRSRHKQSSKAPFCCSMFSEHQDITDYKNISQRICGKTMPKRKEMQHLQCKVESIWHHTRLTLGSGEVKQLKACGDTPKQSVNKACRRSL